MGSLRTQLRSSRTLIAAAALGAGALALTQSSLRSAYYEWRTHVDETTVQGRTVSYRDTGSGSPVVVIASGMDCHKDSYLDLHMGLSEVTRVIAYDRAGIGDSTPSGEPATLDRIDREMKALLDTLNAPPPYVLIGHSMGGHIIRYYTDKHPGEVAALVFLDHPHEDWFRYIRATWSKQEIDEYFVWWGIGEENGRRLERPEYETNGDMVRGMKIDPSISALMFTGNNTGHFRKQPPGIDQDRKAWADMQAEIIAGLPDAKHIIDFETGHFMHLDKPQAVLDEITKLVLRLREKKLSPR